MAEQETREFRRLSLRLFASNLIFGFTAMALVRNRERPEKIVVAMHRLARGTTKMLKYEDIVVEAFKMFPDEFALRGYPQYPDSSDVHKPLYGMLKRKGLVRAAHKTFGLTAKGVDTAQRLIDDAGASLDVARSADRMTRDAQTEVDRMLASDAFTFFVEGKLDKILDTDFYNFIGCTVRTPANDFLGRVSASGDAVNTAARLTHPDRATSIQLSKTWAHLQSAFKAQIDRRRERK